MQQFDTLNQALDNESFCNDLDDLNLTSCYQQLNNSAARLDLYNSLVAENINPFSNMEEIPDYLFYKSPIQSVIIPANIDKIGIGAFEDCFKLESVTFENGIIAIKTSAFESCIRLKSITLPSSLRYLHSYSFGACQSLHDIKIEANDDLYINPYTFKNCFGLRKITFDGTIEEWGSICTSSKVFDGCFDVTVICLDGVIQVC